MANQRIYQIHGLKVAETAVGGIQAFNTAVSFAQVNASTPDGAAGPEDLDLAGLTATVDLTTTDITKLMTLLQESAGGVTFVCDESGAATDHEFAVAGVVWTGFQLNIPFNADANVRLVGQIKFAEASTAALQLVAKLGQIDVQAADAGTYPQTYPARVWQPSNASFDPTGAPAAIAPLHVQGFTLSGAANVLTDFGDLDAGISVVDIANWGPMQAALTIRDGVVDTVDTAGLVMAGQLVTAIEGALTIDLRGRAAGAADAYTLTLNGLKFHNYTEALGPGLAGWTVNGQTQWRLSDATALTLPTMLAIA
jgi:hypothetical protein